MVLPGNNDIKVTASDALEFEPIAAEMRRLLASSDYIDDILRKGAARAAAMAEPNLTQIKEIIGLLDP